MKIQDIILNLLVSDLEISWGTGANPALVFGQLVELSFVQEPSARNQARLEILECD